MNVFEKKVLPVLWSKAVNNNINIILHDEMSSYHKYAKRPDTGENFRRFYSHIESLHSYLAQKSAEDLFCTTDSSDSSKFKKRLKILSNLLNLEQFFNLCKKIVVLKGGIDLAHGDVLKKQIRNLSNVELRHIGLILIDYPSSKVPSEISNLGIRYLSLGNHENLKDRYALISYGLANFTQKYGDQKEIIWWAIPFGMIFTYQLASNLAYQSGSLVCCKKSYLTVKHHHSFSHDYLDKIYTSTPYVGGFLNLYKPKVSTFMPSFYDKNMLVSDSSLLNQKDKLVLANLQKIKANGARLFSSVSRIEKTCDTEYLNVIQGVLENIEESVLICFGKILPPQYQRLLTRFGKTRVFFAGWCTPALTVKIIGMLDLFLDPFPFGAGMTFASAGYQIIPIISTSDFVNSSPSSISILYYFYKNEHICLDKAVSESLFGPATSILDRSINVMKNKDYFLSRSAELKVIIEQVFVRPRTSILSS